VVAGRRTASPPRPFDAIRDPLYYGHHLPGLFGICPRLWLPGPAPDALAAVLGFKALKSFIVMKVKARARRGCPSRESSSASCRPGLPGRTEWARQGSFHEGHFVVGTEISRHRGWTPATVQAGPGWPLEAGPGGVAVEVKVSRRAARRSRPAHPRPALADQHGGPDGGPVVLVPFPATGSLNALAQREII